MDELDLLKKDWKKQEGNYPKLSYDEIYKMIWKKSSSIVKWIFVISIIEFLFWAVMNVFLADNEYWKEMERIHLKGFTIALYIIGYIITFYFIYNFYQNYRKISSTDNAAHLMESILKTRKTVKYYIWYVLISSGLTALVYTYFMLRYHATETQVEKITTYDFNTKQWLIFLGLMFVFFAVFLGLIWLFYRLLYGILLKRLSKNYKELKKLEV
ncbi:hypothetical protein L1I30_09155 [Gillisia sp. M10.2A]|uniref:Uncharacterized protein n=1 Tax=Gillisia lutea TaxID=2909668 RepID=A0ABS9EG20_9FLAO|nr:hypothetical protein [Gillisia lutea]MCF4101832.1 hypothetical protein [Gillisia lutea]